MLLTSQNSGAFFVLLKKELTTLPRASKNKEEENMKIIVNNKLDLHTLKSCISKPEIYSKSTDKFWDDEHISAQMLKFHLNPEVEAASKKKETIEAETAFIIGWTEMDKDKAVLDLGCGPGLYVKEFAKTGAKITGIDLSMRSVNYANENIRLEKENITFSRMNYLEMNFKDAFDIVTLIFYDFCVLSSDEQKKLLVKIYEALKDKGIFIFDVVSANRKTSISTNISICEGGFWSPNPYIEIMNTNFYEHPRTEGVQYTLINEDGEVKVIRLYHRLFALEEIVQLLRECHFEVEAVYRNLQGDALSGDSEAYGIFARKTK